jgi:gliding motility-associated-like protein
MKRSTPITLSILFLCLSIAQAQIIDNFESGNLNAWTLESGFAGTTNIEVFSGNNSLQIGTHTFLGPTLLTHNTFSDDYGRYGVHFHCEGGVSDFLLYFQYVNPDNFYGVSASPLGSDNPGLRLIKMTEGVLEEIAFAEAVFSLGEWRELIVERRCDNEIAVYIDTELQISVIDDTFQSPGKVALGAWSWPVYADDLRFEPFGAEVKILGDPTFCNEPTKMEASGNFASYLWSTGSKQRTADVDEQGIVSLEVTDINGCKAVDSVFVLTFCPSTFYAPNVFSPNFDGVNDEFQVFPQKNIAQFRLLVFNRWGELVFETQNLNEGWDGTFRGKVAPQDMYIWTANLDGFAITGNVLLIR